MGGGIRVIVIEGPVGTQVTLKYPTNLLLPPNVEQANLGWNDSEHGFIVHASSSLTAVWSVDPGHDKSDGNHSIEVFIPTLGVSGEWVVIPRLERESIGGPVLSQHAILADGIIRGRYKSQANKASGQIRWRAN